MPAGIDNSSLELPVDGVSLNLSQPATGRRVSFSLPERAGPSAAYRGGASPSGEDSVSLLEAKAASPLHLSPTAADDDDGGGGGGE